MWMNETLLHDYLFLANHDFSSMCRCTYVRVVVVVVVVSDVVMRKAGSTDGSESVHLLYLTLKRRVVIGQAMHLGCESICGLFYFETSIHSHDRISIWKSCCATVPRKRIINTSILVKNEKCGMNANKSTSMYKLYLFCQTCRLTSDSVQNVTHSYTPSSLCSAHLFIWSSFNL